MRSNKKQYNKKNRTKKKYIKGGLGMPTGGMPPVNPMAMISQAASLGPLLLKLVPYINQAKTVGPMIIEKYLSKNPGELAILGANLLGKVQTDSELINLIKEDNPNFHSIYQNFITILKEFEPEAVSLFENIISVFCSEIKSINSILNNAQIKPFITPIKEQINVFIGIIEGKIPDMVSEIEKVETLKPLVPKITGLIRKFMEVLKGEIDTILTGACSIMDPNSNMLKRNDLTDTVTASAAAANSALRHSRPVKKTTRDPVENEGVTTTVEPEKIKGTIHRSTETIHNDDDEFSAIINIPPGLDIDSIAIDIKYPLRVDASVEVDKESETLRFIANPTRDEFVYTLPSSVKSKGLDMKRYTFNEVLMGKTKLNNGKDADIKLVNFTLKRLNGNPVYKPSKPIQFYDENGRLYANNRVPIKLKSNIMTVYPKEIKGSLTSEDKTLKIKRTATTIEFTFKKNNGIEIASFKYKIDYPEKVWIDTGLKSGKKLLFVLDTSSGKVIYRLSSDQTVTSDEMPTANLPTHLKGAIEITDNGRISMKQINLENFEQRYKKSSSAFKIPGNLFKFNSNTKQPIYVLI